MSNDTPDRFPETPIERAPTYTPPPETPETRTTADGPVQLHPNHPYTDEQIFTTLEGKQ